MIAEDDAVKLIVVERPYSTVYAERGMKTEERPFEIK